MTDFEAGRFQYKWRHRIMETIEGALPVQPDVNGGEVVVIVRVTAPQMDEEERIKRTIAEALRD